MLRGEIPLQRFEERVLALRRGQHALLRLQVADDRVAEAEDAGARAGDELLAAIEVRNALDVRFQLLQLLTHRIAEFDGDLRRLQAGRWRRGRARADDFVDLDKRTRDRRRRFPRRLCGEAAGDEINLQSVQGQELLLLRAPNPLHGCAKLAREAADDVGVEPFGLIAAPDEKRRILRNADGEDVSANALQRLARIARRVAARQQEARERDGKCLEKANGHAFALFATRAIAPPVCTHVRGVADGGLVVAAFGVRRQVAALKAPTASAHSEVALKLTRSLLPLRRQCAHDHLRRNVGEADMRDRAGVELKEVLLDAKEKAHDIVTEAERQARADRQQAQALEQLLTRREADVSERQAVAEELPHGLQSLRGCLRAVDGQTRGEHVDDGVAGPIHVSSRRRSQRRLG